MYFLAEATTGLGIVAVIAAIVGPFIGVYFATLTRRAATRQEASALFRRITEDSQNYRHAFLDMHHFRTDLSSNTGKLN